MKKQFQHGFWAGLLTAGLLLALGLTVLAAGRTISIDDGIRITFNGAAFTPKDANGKPVELFCAIGDDMIDGKPYGEIVEQARQFIRSVGGFEAFAEWGVY